MKLLLVELCTVFVAACAVLGGPRADGLAAFVREALLLALACIVPLACAELYDLRAVWPARAFAVRLFLALALAAALLWPMRDVAPAGALVALLVLAAAQRVLVHAVLRSRPSGERILILGAGRLAVRLLQELEARPHLRPAVAVVASSSEEAQRLRLRVPVLGTLREVNKIIDALRPDRIVVALDGRRRQAAVAELLACWGRGAVVEDALAAYERLTGKVAIEVAPASALVFSPGFRRSRIHGISTRALGLAVAAAGVVVLAPLFAVVAAAIALDSRGPVFFVQARVGKGGRPFHLIKFRTMHVAAGPRSEWVRDNADRITRVGAWLRKFRLDELPQFINILRGDMNLVGPRPHPVSNYQLFVARIPYYALRSAVRPGLTGWAQVHYGYANDLEEETEKMRYDLYYIKHRSLALDLRILAGTLAVVLTGQAAPTVRPAPALDRARAS